MADFWTLWWTLLLTYLLHSTLLLGLTWLALSACRVTSPALQETCWKAAAVLGVVTAPLQMGLGSAPPLIELDLGAASVSQRKTTPPGRREQSEPVVVSATTPSASVLPERTLPSASPARMEASTIQLLGSGEDADAGSAAIRPQSVPRSSPPAFRTAEIARPAPAPNRVVAFGPAEIAGLAILAATAIGLLRLLAQSCLLGRQVAQAKHIEHGALHAQLERLLQRAGVRRKVRLLASSCVNGPVAFGLWRWTIVLPDRCGQRPTAAETEAILAHELAHLVRGDCAWLWISRLLCAALPIQPLNFVARRAWRRAAELRCDDWTVGLGLDPLALARCLTQVAESKLRDRLAALTLPAIGSPGMLAQRIERLVADADRRRDPWTSKPRKHALVVATVLLGAVLTGWGPRAGAWGDVTGADRETPSRAAVDPRPEWNLLERDLQRLEHKLKHAMSLLRTRSTDPELERLVQRIAERTQSLKSRREVFAPTVRESKPASH